MGVRYLFNTSGDYVAFIQGDNLFNPDGEWLGVVLNGNEVYNTDGLYIGTVSDDDRVVSDRRLGVTRFIPRPMRPPRPLRPLRPLRRLRMFRVPYPYEDVFEHFSGNVTRLVPRRQLRQFDYLIGAEIYAHDGAFLGVISKDRLDQRSISNEFGPFGGQFSNTSIFNEFGSYGGEFSSMSPFNPFSSSPPRIVQNGQNVGYLTVNQFMPQRIDSNELVAWLHLD